MISKEEIRGLAELARLEISEAEVALLQKDISNILEYVGQIRAVQGDGQCLTLDQGSSRLNLSKVLPLVHNVMREDVPREESDVLAGKRESLLAALPKREGDYAVVRKIIQKDE